MPDKTVWELGMETCGATGRSAIARAQFVCLLLIHKSEIGMADVSDDELETLAPAVLGSLVRLSLRAFQDPDEPDNACRIAALWWFIEWAGQNIDGYLESSMCSIAEAVPVSPTASG